MISESALRFIDSWSRQDVYDRFGTTGIDARRLLACRLTQRCHFALAAVHGNEVVGLLDYAYAGDEIHIGIVVDRRFRRRSIGTALILALLAEKPREQAVVAECVTSNRPAVALLQRCCFELVGSEKREMTWRKKSPPLLRRAYALASGD